jgi:hypothetical protein
VVLKTMSVDEAVAYGEQIIASPMPADLAATPPA